MLGITGAALVLAGHGLAFGGILLSGLRAAALMLGIGAAGTVLGTSLAAALTVVLKKGSLRGVMKLSLIHILFRLGISTQKNNLFSSSGFLSKSKNFRFLYFYPIKIEIIFQSSIYLKFFRFYCAELHFLISTDFFTHYSFIFGSIIDIKQSLLTV